jgi:hypothetical protein
MPADRNLHRNVREAYRQAMEQYRTQREAFQSVVDLVLERRSSADPASAGRAVAVMLANEPELPAAFARKALLQPRGDTERTQIIATGRQPDRDRTWSRPEGGPQSGDLDALPGRSKPHTPPLVMAKLQRLPAAAGQLALDTRLAEELIDLHPGRRARHVGLGRRVTTGRASDAASPARRGAVLGNLRRL